MKSYGKRTVTLVSVHGRALKLRNLVSLSPSVPFAMESFYCITSIALSAVCSPNDETDYMGIMSSL